MSASPIVSWLALVLSVLGLLLSGFLAWRDRPHLLVSCLFYPERDGGPACIKVICINAGRRPVVLYSWGGYSSEGRWSCTYFDYAKSGHVLGEHQRHEMLLQKSDMLGQSANRATTTLLSLRVFGWRIRLENGIKSFDPRNS